MALDLTTYKEFVCKITKFLRERKRMVYFIISLVTLVASIIAIIESKWIKPLFLKPPEVSHLGGWQPRPHVIWEKFENKDAIAGIEHKIPIYLTNNNDIPLKIEDIEIDWGKFNLTNKETLVRKLIGLGGLSESVLAHGHLFGDCTSVDIYETEMDIYESKSKNVWLPYKVLYIRPYEKMLLTLEFQLHFEKEPPRKYFIVKETKDEFEAMFDRLMPMFFGFDSPNREDSRPQRRTGTIIFHTNHGVFRVRTWFILPFVGTIANIPTSKGPLGIVFK